MKLASRFSASINRLRRKLARSSSYDVSAPLPKTMRDDDDPAETDDTIRLKLANDAPAGLAGQVSLNLGGLKKIIRSFSITERVVFGGLVALFATATFGFANAINDMFLIEIPTSGGAHTEGVVGIPQLINPVLASSDADRDLAALVYSGLLRATPSGDLVGDLAARYSISPDGLTYTFILKDGLLWHDGEPITADDIVYTVQVVKNPKLASPRRASWEGVTVEKIDDKTVRFVLKQPYAPFIENATLGILPKHAWENIDPEQFGLSILNVSPMGSGPYEVEEIKKGQSGIPLYYDLVPFRKFALGKPHIERVRIRFYPSESDVVNALENGEIDAASALSARTAKELEGRGYRVEKYTLPRIFAVFFNAEANPAFADKAVREALSRALDRTRVIDEVLYGYAVPITGPIAPGSIGYAPISATSTFITQDIEGAAAVLDKAGWIIGVDGIREKKTAKGMLRFEFSISTSEVGELAAAAGIIKESWERLGARVELKIFKTSDLSETVIRPRKYDALFFGEIVGRGSDPFAFWHSSQRTDPGLNIAGYNSPAADKLLAQGRVEQDPVKRSGHYAQLGKLIEEDIPAAFVYSPDFIYIVPEDAKGIPSDPSADSVGRVALPSERFSTIHTWYRESEKVWRAFLPTNHPITSN